MCESESFQKFHVTRNPMGWNVTVISVFTDEENEAKIIFVLIKVGNPVTE